MHAGHVRKIYLMDKGEPIPSAIRSSGKYVNHSILSILLPFPHPINWNISQHDTLKQERQWKHSTLAMCVGKRSSRGFFVNIESTVIPDFFLWFQLQCGSRQKRNLSVPMPTELKSNKKLSLGLLTEVYLSSFDFFFFLHLISSGIPNHTLESPGHFQDIIWWVALPVVKCLRQGGRGSGRGGQACWVGMVWCFLQCLDQIVSILWVYRP